MLKCLTFRSSSHSFRKRSDAKLLAMKSRALAKGTTDSTFRLCTDGHPYLNKYIDIGNDRYLIIGFILPTDSEEDGTAAFLDDDGRPAALYRAMLIESDYPSLAPGDIMDLEEFDFCGNFKKACLDGAISMEESSNDKSRIETSRKDNDSPFVLNDDESYNEEDYNLSHDASDDAAIITMPSTSTTTAAGSTTVAAAIDACPEAEGVIDAAELSSSFNTRLSFSTIKKMTIEIRKQRLVRTRLNWKEISKSIGYGGNMNILRDKYVKSIQKHLKTGADYSALNLVAAAEASINRKDESATWLAAAETVDRSSKSSVGESLIRCPVSWIVLDASTTSWRNIQDANQKTETARL